MAAVGETPNLAARVQALADPDAILLTAATHRLLRGAFVCEALGPRRAAEVLHHPHVGRDPRGQFLEGQASAYT
jgi:class 3 adenylate cyclase